MGGIAGMIVLAKAKDFDSFAAGQAVRRMSDVFSNRQNEKGAAGQWVSADSSVILGQRREAQAQPLFFDDQGRKLSETAARVALAQPLVSVCKRATIVFEGVLFNAPDVRARLESLGFLYQSNDPAEVVLNAYLQNGPACLKDLDGDFSFAIWDEQKKKLFLARDRLGARPLFFYQDDHCFIFASDLRALLASGHVPKTVDEESLFYYLTYQSAPSGRTLVARVEKLPAAAFISLDRDGLRTSQKYADFFPHSKRAMMPGLEDELADLIDQSIQKRTTGNQQAALVTSPFGKTLLKPAHLKSFSVGIDFDPCRLAFDVPDLITPLMAASDEPFGDFTQLAQAQATGKALRSGAQNVLTSAGAEDLFCGHAVMRKSLARFKALDALPRGLAGLASFLTKKAERYADWASLTDQLDRRAKDQMFFLSAAPGFFDHEKQKILAPACRSRFKGMDSYAALRSLHVQLKERAPDAGFIQQMITAQTFLAIPERVLAGGDKISKALGVRQGAFFADPALVAFALRAPDEFLWGSGRVSYSRQGFSSQQIQSLFAGLALIEPDFGLSSYFDVGLLRRWLKKRRLSLREVCLLWSIYAFAAWKLSVIDDKIVWQNESPLLKNI